MSQDQHAEPPPEAELKEHARAGVHLNAFNAAIARGGKKEVVVVGGDRRGAAHVPLFYPGDEFLATLNYCPSGTRAGAASLMRRQLARTKKQQARERDAGGARADEVQRRGDTRGRAATRLHPARVSK